MSASLVIAMLLTGTEMHHVRATVEEQHVTLRATINEQCEYLIAIAETICFLASFEHAPNTRRPPELLIGSRRNDS